MNDKFTAIVDRLAQETATVKYGEVSAALKIHDGRIKAVTYSITENKREVEK